MFSKTVQFLMLVTILVFTTCLPAFAWHRHGGIWIVGPRWIDPYPYPYSYPYYYTVPPPVVIQQQPETYIQQPAPAPAPKPTYWYYCPSSQGYYPYVKECPAGWMKVVPTTPEAPDNQPQQP